MIHIAKLHPLHPGQAERLASNPARFNNQERLDLVPRGGLQEYRLFLLISDIEIYQRRRAGMYDYGRVPYEKGGFNFNETGDEAQMEVEEDYQVCARRIS